MKPLRSCRGIHSIRLCVNESPLYLFDGGVAQGVFLVVLGEVVLDIATVFELVVVVVEAEDFDVGAYSVESRIQGHRCCEVGLFFALARATLREQCEIMRRAVVIVVECQ